MRLSMFSTQKFKPTQISSLKNVLSDYKETNEKPARSSQYPVRILSKENSRYFFKPIGSSKNAEIDIDIRSENFISQFIRMIVPREPKTDIIFENEDDEYPIGFISKKVEGFKDFDSYNYLHFIFSLLSGRITGIGDICAIWLLTAEGDGKVLGNVGANNKNQAIKLDNGETRLKYYHPGLSRRFPIKANDIDNLPLPPYFVKNKSKGSTWFYPFNSRLFLLVLLLLSCKKSIRAEVNTTVLKFILIHPGFIALLISHLIRRNNYAENCLLEQIQERMSDARKSALHSKSFRKFMNEKSAEIELKNFKQNLETFKLPRETPLAELCPGYKEEIDNTFNSLKNDAKNYANPDSLNFKINSTAVILLLGMAILFLTRYLLAATPSAGFKNKF